MPSDLSGRLRAAFEVEGAADRRLLPMEGLRGLAVTLVFFVHFGSLIHPWISQSTSAPIADGLQLVGNTGVDLFFALSGYLIYGSLIRRPQPFFVFIVKRIRRLYPAFATVLAIYIALSVAIPAEHKIPHGWERGLMYLGANALLLPGIFNIQPLVTVAWSLSYEMFFYLAIPLLIAVLALRSWSPSDRVLFFIGAIVLGSVVGFPYPRMYLFCCGILLVEILPKFATAGRRYHIGADITAGAAASACGMMILQHKSETIVLGMTAISVILIFLASLSHQGVIAGILTFRPLRWLGNISYSYYLLHGLILKILFFALAILHAPRATDGWLYWSLLAPAFTATIVGSAVFFHQIERGSLMAALRNRRLTPLSTSAFPAPENVMSLAETSTVGSVLSKRPSPDGGAF